MMTAAATTGPARQPRPASSQPANGWGKSLSGLTLYGLSAMLLLILYEYMPRELSLTANRLKISPARRQRISNSQRINNT
jgi:hypothetical protein